MPGFVRYWPNYTSDAPLARAPRRHPRTARGYQPHYHQQQPGLGDDFDAQVVAAIHDLCEWPGSWPPVPGWNREPPLRSRQVAIFPYRVVYFVDQEEAVIVAYAHASREPGYWQDRLNE